jgi:hypothetical protein
MKKHILFIGACLALASCGRYSQVRELPQKDEMQANSRVYGEVDGPARQSKQSYPTPADAADRSAKIKTIMFGKAVANQKENTSAPATTSPADSVAATDSAAGK